MELFVEASDFRRSRLEIAARASCVALTVAVVPPTHEVVAQAAPPRLPVLRVAAAGAASAPPLLLSGTNAILRYLGALRADGAGGGAGFTAYDESATDQWLEWAARELDPVVALLAGEHAVAMQGVVRAAAAAAAAGAGATPQQPPPLSLSPGEAAAGAVAHARARLPSLLHVLGAHLATRTFLAGERLGLADIAVAATLEAVAAEAARALPPAAARWLLTCRHAPPFLAVLGAPRPLRETAAPVAGAAGAAAAAAASPPPPPPTYSDTASAAACCARPTGAAAICAVRGDGSVSAVVPSALTAFATSLPDARYRRFRQRVADVLLAGEALAGAAVTVCGWARTVREAGAGKLAFIALNDGSTAECLQVVAEAGVTAGFEAIAGCGGVHASFRVEGVLVRSPAKGQPVELAARALTLLGAVAEPATYPLAKKRHTAEYLRDLPHLRPRTALISAVARIRNACAYATHRFFQDRGFAYVHTPIVTGADCEGAGEMFQVTTLLPADAAGDVPRAKPAAPGAPAPIDYGRDFFGKPAMLTVSGQLQVETYAHSLSDVYTFGPTFRAELSHTTRHLAEFWMIEPEIAFATLEDDMALAEDFLKFATHFVLEHCERDIAYFEDVIEKGLRARLLNVVAQPFQRLTYTEAVALLLEPEHLAAGAFTVKPYWGLDLGSEHERYLTERVFKKPVILINYPKEIKAFYMKVNPDNKTVAAMDILVPKVGEIIGGSQREDRYETLRARMAEMHVPEAPLKWYLDLRRYGTVPHAGFGLGFERLVMYVTGIENIREAIPFPRWPGNAQL